MALKNREAVAILLGFQNALHDAVHAGTLTAPDVVGLLMIANRDSLDLLRGQQVEVRFHEGQTISLDSESAQAGDMIINNMIQFAAESVEDPNLPKPTVFIDPSQKKVVN